MLAFSEVRGRWWPLIYNPPTPPTPLGGLLAIYDFELRPLGVPNLACMHKQTNSANTMATNIEMNTGDYRSDSKPGFTTSNDVEVQDDRIVGEIVETRRIQQKFGILRKARDLEELMDRKLGVESQVR